MRLSGFGMQISGLVQQMPDLVYPCLMHKEGGSSENFFQSMKTDKKADLDFVWDLLSDAKEKVFAGFRKDMLRRQRSALASGGHGC